MRSNSRDGVAPAAVGPVPAADANWLSSSRPVRSRLLRGSGRRAERGRGHRHFAVVIDAGGWLGRGGLGSLLHDGSRDTSRDVLDALHETLEPAAAEEHLALAAVEDAGEERALESQDRQHPLLDRA